jgi:(+)-pinoresinol hydroxylase
MSKTLLALVLLTAGGSVLAQDGPAERGRQLYPRQCGICHLQNNFATGMLAKRLGKEKSLLDERNDLQPEYIRFIVRNGIASMPALTRVQTTDEDLAAITAYLVRNNSPK